MKRSGPISEATCSENWNFLHASPSQVTVSTGNFRELQDSILENYPHPQQKRFIWHKSWTSYDTKIRVCMQFKSVKGLLSHRRARDFLHHTTPPFMAYFRGNFWLIWGVGGGLPIMFSKVVDMLEIFSEETPFAMMFFSSWCRSLQNDYRRTCLLKAMNSKCRYRNMLPENFISITETDLWEWWQKISHYRYILFFSFQVVSITDTDFGLKMNRFFNNFGYNVLSDPLSRDLGSNLFDTPYSTIPRRHPNKMRQPLPWSAPLLQRALFEDQRGV